MGVAATSSESPATRRGWADLFDQSGVTIEVEVWKHRDAITCRRLLAESRGFPRPVVALVGQQRQHCRQEGKGHGRSCIKPTLVSRKRVRQPRTWASWDALNTIL